MKSRAGRIAWRSLEIVFGLTLFPVGAVFLWTGVGLAAGAFWEQRFHDVFLGAPVLVVGILCWIWFVRVVFNVPVREGRLISRAAMASVAVAAVVFPLAALLEPNGSIASATVLPSLLTAPILLALLWIDATRE